MPSRKNYSPAFKAKVDLAALSGEKTTAEFTSEYGVHSTMINKWKKQLCDNAPSSCPPGLSCRAKTRSQADALDGADAHMPETPNKCAGCGT